MRGFSHDTIAIHGTMIQLRYMGQQAIAEQHHLTASHTLPSSSVTPKHWSDKDILFGELECLIYLKRYKLKTLSLANPR